MSNNNSKDVDTCERVLSHGMFVTQQQGNFSKKYQGVKVLGKGNFGEVICCRDRNTKTSYAVKVVRKRTLRKSADRFDILQEIELLKKLDHPNIMKLFEFYEDSKYFYLVGELYTGGEVFDEIVKRKQIAEPTCANMMQQVLSGIAYCHCNNVVHRDLKPENLLLENKSRDANIKIIDFGLSCFMQSNLKDKIGTAYYIAPEVIGGKYNEKCDVWSAGVIMYIMLSGFPPFHGDSEGEILKRVMSGKYSFSMNCFKKVSVSAKNLISSMINLNVNDRISALEALNHEWIKTMTVVDENQVSPLQFQDSLNMMKKFRGGQTLADAALLYMGAKLTSTDETKELLEVFRKLDINGDGQLDRDELKLGMRELMKMRGVEEEDINEETLEIEVDQVLESIDFDNNGYLEYSEFVAVAMDRQRLLTEDRLRKAFEMFDTDGSGSISTQELIDMFSMAGLDVDACREIVLSADQDNNGEIEFDEFCVFMKKICCDEMRRKEDPTEQGHKNKHQDSKTERVVKNEHPHNFMRTAG